MPINERYRQQVALLVQALPAVAEEKAFALKGDRHQSFRP